MRRIIPPAAIAALALLLAPASALGVQIGIGENNPAMFKSRYYKVLHTRIARYVAPYDVADRPRDLAVVNAWITAAEASGVQPLIAFYHSRSHPNGIPSPGAYVREVRRFIQTHPQITYYSAWNEANRSRATATAPGETTFRGPNPNLAADYYLGLRRVCPNCTIVGLDVLDSTNIASTIRYIRAFEHRVRGHLPRIWGLHNYSDTNRFRSTGTRAVLRAVHGQLWLTETGGVVKFGREFPNRHGSGLARARRALSYMFRLAAISPRITRLYIFDWYGTSASARFDAGLMDRRGHPRPGYAVVRRRLRGF
jgi:hypothetical protein